MAQIGSIASALLAAIGVALGCAVLEATGRRFLAFVPMPAAPWVGYRGSGILGSGPWWGGASWPSGDVANVVVTLGLVAVPAVAVAAVIPRRPRAGVAWSAAGAAVATILCALVIVPLHALTSVAFGRHYPTLGWTSDAGSLIFPAFVIAAFAAILGPNRRWWPWILAPVAILLSLGPSMAVLIGPEGIMDLGRFGAVVPLAAVGLVFSAWRPLASWLSLRIAAFGDDDDEDDDEAVWNARTAVIDEPVTHRIAPARAAFARSSR